MHRVVMNALLASDSFPFSSFSFSLCYVMLRILLSRPCPKHMLLPGLYERGVYFPKARCCASWFMVLNKFVGAYKFTQSIL